MDIVQSRPGAGPDSPAVLDPSQALRVKMRELVWRMDQVGQQLRSPRRAIDDQTLAMVLDTSDAKALLSGGVDDFR